MGSTVPFAAAVLLLSVLESSVCYLVPSLSLRSSASRPSASVSAQAASGFAKCTLAHGRSLLTARSAMLNGAALTSEVTKSVEGRFVKADDLLIVGGGMLGSELCKLMSECDENKQRVIATTKTDTFHPKLKAAGAEPYTELPEYCKQGMGHVFFAVTPNVEKYVEEVRMALRLWLGTPGKFVLASSVGVFDQHEGTVDESFPTKDSKMLQAENLVREAGGTVLRFGGLYNLEKDRRSFFLNNTELKASADQWIGLVGYRDAARAVLAALNAGTEVDGEVFTITDGHDQTMEDVFMSALKAGKYAPRDDMPVFSAEATYLGHTYDTSKAKVVLGWEAQTKSWDEYCVQMAARGEAEDNAGD